VVAFQNRNPIHKAHFELLERVSKDIEGSVVLVHPTSGPTQPDDIDGPTRIPTYEALEAETRDSHPHFHWAYLPYSMKMAGPREALVGGVGGLLSTILRMSRHLGRFRGWRGDPAHNHPRRDSFHHRA